MKLSKNAFREIKNKCERRFPRKVGFSTEWSKWSKFCNKNPIEFRGIIDGAEYIIRVSSDAYAVCVPNPSGIFKIYSF